MGWLTLFCLILMFTMISLNPLIINAGFLNSSKHNFPNIYLELYPLSKCEIYIFLGDSFGILSPLSEFFNLWLELTSPKVEP